MIAPCDSFRSVQIETKVNQRVTKSVGGNGHMYRRLFCCLLTLSFSSVLIGAE